MPYSNNSLKSYILGYVRNRYPEWVHKGTIGREAVLSWGYENENMGRRCRDLVKEGKLEVKLEKEKGVRCAWYRWIPPKIETEAEHIESLARQGVFG